MRHTLIVLLKKLKIKFQLYNITLPYLLRMVVAFMVVVAGIFLFMELTKSLTTTFIANYDRMIAEYVISFRTPALTQFFILITNVGDIYGYLLVIGLGLLISWVYIKRWKQMVQMMFVLICASIFNVLLKQFFQRARPSNEHLVLAETLSYPSGHAMSAMAFYGFVIFLFYRSKMNRFLKYSLILLLFLLIVCIGVSRIYLGVHFPSDIAGGYIAGFIWVVFCIIIFDLIEIFKGQPNAS